jgi:prephenate dehydratase
VLLVPDDNEKRTISVIRQALKATSEPTPTKMSLALRLAHKPGALLAALQPFARHDINLMKVESRPIHGSPWVYQFFLDVETSSPEKLEAALSEVKTATSFLRILGLYKPARPDPSV